MTKIVIAQDAPVLVAIDIAKARHEVLIAIPGKKCRRRLTVLNQMEDLQLLCFLLRSHLRQTPHIPERIETAIDHQINENFLTEFPSKPQYDWSVRS